MRGSLNANIEKGVVTKVGIKEMTDSGTVNELFIPERIEISLRH